MKYIFSLILILFIHYSCLANNEVIAFKSLTTEMGLSHGDVFCFLQDHDGYMWIGTSDGLNKFDGINFTVSKNSKKDSSSLSSSYISCLFEDSKNNLWIGVLNGLCRYNRDKNNFERINLIDNHGHRFSHHVFSIFEDRDNNLWLGTQHGIFKFDMNKRTISAFFDKSSGQEVQTNCSDIRQDTRGNIWFALKDAKNGGLLKYNPATGSSVKFNNQSPGFKLKENFINCILFDEKDNLWVGYNSNGIDVIDLKDGKIKSYVNENGNSKSLNNNYIFSIAQDHKKVYIGTGQGGLNVFDKAEKKFIYHKSAGTDKSLLSNIIQSVYPDHNGTLWVGCWGGGVSYYNCRFERFKLYKHVKNDINSLDGSSVTCFTQDKSGNIWVSSDGGGINLFYPLNGSFKRFNSTNTPLTNNKVLALGIDSKNILWAGMWQGGLNCFEILGDKLVFKKKYDLLDNNDLNSNCIFKIFIDKDGDLWIGSYAHGAYKYNKSDDNFEPLYLPVSSSEYTVRDIFSDSQNNIWISTEYYGLYQYNKKTGKIGKFLYNENDTNSLTNNSVNFTYEDSKKRIWVGVDEGGLNLLNPVDNTFSHFTTEDGLADNTVVGILEDNNGDIWVSSHLGISKVIVKNSNEKIKLSFKNYSSHDGLQGNLFNRWAYLKSKDGELFFGGLNGFNTFHPDSINDNKYKPPVLFTDFLLFNKTVPIGTKNSPLKKHISQTNEIVLKYNQSFFTFRFVALNYIFSEKNQYAYFMEGFDNQWNYVEGKQEATYTNLGPGEYTFKVIASNNDGIWNDKGTSVKITILPPWWGAWWFRILFMVAMVSSLLAIYISRMKRFRKRQLFLEKVVAERTHELLEINIALEEKQEEINLQKEELEEQKDYLLESNNRLVQQQEKISEQNIELDKHRNELEKLIAERTQELENARHKAEESDKLKSSFLANMSHEIRTPMNAIMGFSNLLCDENLSKIDKKNFVEIIIRSGESLLVLIDDILDLSKIQAGQLVLVKKPVDIINIFQELYRTFSIEASRYKISLDYNKENLPDSYIIQADPIRLKQIFNNLISNAIKFTSEGGIEFGIKRKTSNEITFFVKDTGIGIQEGTGDSIFETFLKIETDSTKLFGGVGLGLAICKSLVSLMEGRIWYDSVVNSGTTFYFSIPLIELNDQSNFTIQEKKQTLAIPDLSGKTILIAEDEENNYKLINAVLKKTSATILWAKDGVEAVNVFKQKPSIDLVIMDIKMPQMNGVEANKIIKSFRNDIIVIAHSAFVYQEDIKNFMASGFDFYLPKPLKINELLDVLKKYLEK